MLTFNGARRKAALEQCALTSLIEDGLRAVLSEHRKIEKRTPVAPRIVKAGGGLMPGVDLTDPSTPQEADDLAFIRRMQRLE